MGYIDFMLVSFHQTILKKIIKEQLNIFKKIVKLHNSYDLCQDISKLATSLEINNLQQFRARCVIEIHDYF